MEKESLRSRSRWWVWFQRLPTLLFDRKPREEQRKEPIKHVHLTFMKRSSTLFRMKKEKFKEERGHPLCTLKGSNATVIRHWKRRNRIGIVVRTQMIFGQGEWSAETVLGHFGRVLVVSCAAPKGGGPEGWGSEMRVAQNFGFFISPATIFFLSSLSWGSFRGILVVSEAPGESN